MTNRTFLQLRYNDKQGVSDPIPFYSRAQGNHDLSQGTALPTLNLDKVYILSTESTCSASEAVINALDGIGVEVVLIGTSTCGKPYGFSGTDNCGTTYFTIQFQTINDVGFGDYDDGFSPSEGQSTFGIPINGCVVGDDFSKSLSDPSEALFSAALGHIETGACPVADPVLVADNANKFGFENPTEGSLLDDPRIASRFMLENQLIVPATNR